jgi:tetratricopeptide (TPR) repeat protein
MKDRAASIYLEVAESLAIEQMHSEANQILERAKSMVSTPQVFLTQSRLCVIQKDLAGASAHLREGLNTNPRSAEILEALAEVELQAKSPEKALEALSQIPQMPEKTVNLCERALREMVKSGRVDEGLALFKPIGRELARRGMGEAATKILRTAMHGQVTTEAWIQLAEVAHQSGNRADHVLALQNAYSLAQQHNDQTLGAWLMERLAELGAVPGQVAAVPSQSPGGRPGTQPIPILVPQDHTLPGTDTTFTDLDPVRRMQIEQLEREAESHLRNRLGERAVDVFKKILELDAANLNAIERIADVHRASGMLTKVQMHYVNTATQLAGLGKKRIAVELLDKAEALFPGSTRMHRRQLGIVEVAAAPAAPPAAPPPPSPVIAPIALGSGEAEPLPPPIAEPIAAMPEFDGIIPLDLPDEQLPAFTPSQGTRPSPIAGLPLPPPPAQPPLPSIPTAELDWADMENLPGIDTGTDILAGIAGESTQMLPVIPPDAGLPPGFRAPAEPQPEFPGDFQEFPEFLEHPPVTVPTPVPGEAPPAVPPAVASMLAAGPVAAVDDELASTLSDIDFQLDYGSPDEAKIEIENALSTWPDHPELLARLRTAEEALRKLGHEPSAGALQPAELEHSFFDLTDVLGDALLETGEGEEMHDATNVVEKVHSVEELFNAFREGVEQQVKSDDYDTHYNLGIAYKEMMLMEPAVEEFKKAMVDPERTLECCSMLSICEQAVGNTDGAIDWLQKGIATPGFPPEDSIGLRYDLGEILLQLGRTNEAVEQFQRVYDMDPEYREVASRL